jgi:Flp pilus assembly protein TadG
VGCRTHCFSVETVFGGGRIGYTLPRRRRALPARFARRCWVMPVSISRRYPEICLASATSRTKFGRHDGVARTVAKAGAALPAMARFSLRKHANRLSNKLSPQPDIGRAVDRTAGRRTDHRGHCAVHGGTMNDRLSTHFKRRAGATFASGRAGNRRRQRGAAVVEFGLLLPLLLVITFGIVEFSIALYDKAVITNASREAARAGIVYSSPRLTNTQISTVATNYCSNYLISLGGKVTPTVSVSHPSGTTSGNPLTVTVSYGYKGFGMSSMVDPMPSLLSMSAATTMNYE